MALTAKRVTKGFEPVRHLHNQPMVPVEYELTSGTAFNKGDMVVLSAGRVAKAAANATNVLGVMAEDVSAADNPAGKTTKARVYDDPHIVFRCSFSDHIDSTATATGTTTTLIDTTLGTSSDDVWNGAFLYIYEGAGYDGRPRTVVDYVGSTDTLVVNEPFPEATDTTTKYILLGAATQAGDVINVGTIGVDLKDENTIDANATVASEAGPLKVLAIYPEELMMDVVIRKHL